jgi:hypothetical protein
MHVEQKVNSFMDSTSLFDCADEPTGSLKGKFLARICRAIGGGPFDRDILARIVIMMYENPDISLQCRSLLASSRNARSEVLDAWADGLREIIENGHVHPELMKVFWRDFALLPEKKRREMEAAVWRRFGDTELGMGTLLSALL